jgi:hypothetical protein
VATVVPAEGVILKRVLERSPAIALEGLSREAYAKFDAAQMKTAWGRHHQRRFALVEGADVLASATQYDFPAVLDQRPVRVCGIGAMLTHRAHRAGGHARELVERLLDQAARDGAAMALLFSDMSQQHQPTGFDPVAMTGAELSSTRSRRSDYLPDSVRQRRANCTSSLPKKASRPQPMSSSASSDACGRLRSAATVIPLVLVSALFCRR